jgi:hypothetical protein
VELPQSHRAGVKHSASSSPKILLKIKTGGQVPRRLRSSRIAAALSSGGWSPTSIRSKGAVEISWQASISSHVINAQDAAGRMPLCVSAKRLTLLRVDHVCDTCCAQFRSTPEYGHTAKVIQASISFMESDLRRFFFGARLALLQGPVFRGTILT